jgi:type III pantothenate kinase
MRSLLIDSGNTIIKAGIYANPNNGVEEKEYFSEFTDLAEYIKNQNPERAIFTDVGGHAKSIENLLNFEDIPFSRCNYLTRLPFKLDYASPETLGDDRIAAVAAGQFHAREKNTLVIDAGTCITYDFVDRNAVYHGGAISPGIKMRFRAMHDFTSALPQIFVDEDVRFENPAKTTKNSMINGVLSGIRNEMQGFIDEYSNKYPDLHVLIGGGDKNFFESSLKGNIFARENLILEGLISILSFHDSL